MSKTPTPAKLTKAQIREGLESVPVSHILGKSASRELTAKQKAFALEVAKGSTGASAYRRVYSSKAKPKTSGDAASRLKGDSRIAAEIQAYELALEGETYRTPAALRALVVQTLAGVLVDPDAKQAVKVQAAKAIGAMTTVSLFTHRVETKIIKSSDDARAELMAQIRELSNASAIDATIIDAQADDLMRELAGSETHQPPTTPNADEESQTYTHTIPPERSPISPELDPPPSTEETPPSGDWK
jgi:hypothetical protein